MPSIRAGCHASDAPESLSLGIRVTVHLDARGCAAGGSLRVEIQLLEARWWPTRCWLPLTGELCGIVPNSVVQERNANPESFLQSVEFIRAVRRETYMTQYFRFQRNAIGGRVLHHRGNRGNRAGSQMK
jgi:hypothetical protein